MLIDAGFPALDLSFSRDYSFALGDDYKEVAARVRALAESRGALFNQAHAPYRGGYELYSTRTRKELPRIIEFAGLVGARNIVVHPLIKYHHFGKEEEHFEMNMEFYSSLAPYAKAAGVRIAIENMWNNHPVTGRIEDSVCADPRELSRYYDELSDPEAFTVCLDIGHVALCGREPADAIRILGGERLGALHVHDNDYIEDLHTLPGMAKINFDSVCRALADVGYNGDFTLEVETCTKNYTKEHLPTVFKFMADTARYYCNIIEGYKKDRL